MSKVRLAILVSLVALMSTVATWLVSRGCYEDKQVLPFARMVLEGYEDQVHESLMAGGVEQLRRDSILLGSYVHRAKDAGVIVGNEYHRAMGLSNLYTCLSIEHDSDPTFEQFCEWPKDHLSAWKPETSWETVRSTLTNSNVSASDISTLKYKVE